MAQRKVPDTYSVVFGRGGPENMTWHQVMATYSSAECARMAAAGIARMGYPTYVYKTSELERIGLPEGPPPANHRASHP